MTKAFGTASFCFSGLFMWLTDHSPPFTDKIFCSLHTLVIFDVKNNFAEDILWKQNIMIGEFGWA
jgi:hypothetical protein